MTTPLFSKTTSRMLRQISQALHVTPRPQEVENEWLTYSFPHPEDCTLALLPPGFGNVVGYTPSHPEEPSLGTVEFWLEEIYRSPMICAQRSRMINYQEPAHVALNHAKVLAMAIRMKELGAQSVNLIAELTPDGQQYHFIDWESRGEHYRIDPSRGPQVEKIRSDYQPESIFMNLAEKYTLGFA
jgi:hypothetical protein